MKKLNTAIFCGFIIAVIYIGVLPALGPPYQMEGTYINWNGRDLSEGITGDSSHFNETYPEFNNTGQLYVYDLRGKPYEAQIALNTLQGLVNKDNASLYLINRDTDVLWMQQVNATPGINVTWITFPNYYDVIDLYNDSIEGLIIYDENFRDTVNVATFLAGVFPGNIVIQGNMLPNFATWGLDANNVTFDFRNNFSSKVELYTWAFNNYGQNASQKGIASISPGQTHFRDYIVALKIFTFWLTPGPFGPIEEINLFRWLLDQFPMNIPLFGWFDEGGPGEYEAIKTMSKSGKYSLNSLPDLTVFSSIQVPSLKQNLTAFDVSNYTVENKVYVSVVISDGDNSNFCLDTLQRYWQDPNRGTVPVGVTYQPILYRICPTSLQYYYQTATSNEYFMAGPSGAGYCYVDMNPAFPQLLNQTKYAMDQTDMDQVWLLNGYEAYPMHFSNEVLNAYASDACNFSAIYLNYHDFPAEVNTLVQDTPLFQSIFLERVEEMIGKLQSLRIASPNEPTFAFVGFWAWDFTFTKLKNAVDQLNNISDDFVFLRPDVFAEVFKKSQVSSEVRLESELNVFIWAGLVPLLGVVIALVYRWGFYKKGDEKTEQKGGGFELFLSKAMFFIVSFVLLLMARYCFYSTFFNLVSAVMFLVAFILGVVLKKRIDRLIGSRNSLVFALSTLSIGIILFLISPKLVIFVGLAIGMLFSHQIRLNSSLFQTRPKNRDFLYIIIIAAALILLIPTEFYFDALFGTVFVVAGFSALSVLVLMRKPLPVEPPAKRWYSKGFLMGFSLLFLLGPTFSPERLFFHLSWGVFPTQLALSFNLAALYLGAILLTEVLEVKGIQISKSKVNLLGLSAVLSYLFMPLLLTGMISFIVYNFIFIFGMMTGCLYVFNHYQSDPTKASQTQSNLKLKTGPNNYLIQIFTWFLIGSFLVFMYPAIFVVDSLELFAGMGMTGMSQLPWPDFVWTIFYLPNVYLFLVVPVTIFVFAVGIVSLLL